MVNGVLEDWGFVKMGFRSIRGMPRMDNGGWRGKRFHFTDFLVEIELV